jgi:hypothetical protein
MQELGFPLREEAVLQTLTEDVLKSSEIEGEIPDKEQVRSSIARRLGIDAAALPSADRNVEGVVEMMLDATQKYQEKLTRDRLFARHASLSDWRHREVHGEQTNRTRLRHGAYLSFAPRHSNLRRRLSLMVFAGSSPITTTSPSLKAHQKSGSFAQPTLPGLNAHTTPSDSRLGRPLSQR